VTNYDIGVALLQSIAMQAVALQGNGRGFTIDDIETLRMVDHALDLMTEDE